MPSTPSSFFSFTSASKVFTAARPAGKLTQSPHLSWHCGTMKMLLDCAQRSTLLTCEFCDVWPLLPFHSLWNILCILMLSRSRFESLAAKRKARKRSANYYKTSNRYQHNLKPPAFALRSSTRKSNSSMTAPKPAQETNWYLERSNQFIRNISTQGKMLRKKKKMKK